MENKELLKKIKELKKREKILKKRFSEIFIIASELYYVVSKKEVKIACDSFKRFIGDKKHHINKE